MADTERYGRVFQFDDDVPADVQEKRISNWMQQNAKDELQPSEPAPQERPRTGGGPPKNGRQNYNPRLDAVARNVLGSMPVVGQMVGALPGVRDKLGDVNTYRTLAQGALPYADEGIAGVRSMMPGGPKYSDALDEERQGLKDYGDTYGQDAKTITELMGAGAGIVGTMGAGAELQGLRGLGPLKSAAQWAMRNPLKGSVLSGAGAGVLGGFGAGEGGFGNRAENAGEHGLLGAIMGPVAYGGAKAAGKGLDILNTNNRVADFLRKKIGMEREGLLSNPNLAKTKDGGVDVYDPNFTKEAMGDLKSGMRDQRNRLYTDPMLSDMLPDTAESVLQKRGPQTMQLARNLRARQYDENAPEAVARGMGQRGRVESAFDLAFGPDTFKATDADLLDKLRTNADAAFKPAYQHNIRSPEIDDALDRLNILDPSQNIWKKAKSWMEADSKSIGSIDATRNMSSYNTEFLHNIKRAMDEHLGEAGRANPKFNQVPFNNVKRDLNNAMKGQNDLYKNAMEQYGDDAGLIGALKKGREEAFPTGSVDVQGGMKGEDIKKYLSDATIPQAQKDLFKLGAARALRESTLASGSKKFSHNWADFVNNPETEDRMGSLLTDKLGSWDLLRAQLKKESQNYKQVAGAMGNSKTASRLAMQEELGDADLGRLAGSLANPGAFGAIKNFSDAAMNKIGMPNKVANKTADLLGRRGATGNRTALRDVENLLRNQDARRGTQRGVNAIAPGAASYAYPYREDSF